MPQMDYPRNMTGIYVGGVIQEGYLPPREKKSSIPSTLYRGHVVKLARAPNSNPHRSSVGRYPMHSLNSGFNGLRVPVKDLMYYKSPEDQRPLQRPKTRGKWTDYPMTIEVKKLAGNGASGSYLAECVLSGDVSASSSKTDQRDSQIERASRQPSSKHFQPSYTPSLLRDNDEEHFYQMMFEEIRQVVSVDDDVMSRNREKLRRILINDSRISIRPDVVSPAARFPKRVSTSYGHPRRRPPPSLVKRPHTTLPTKSTSLLLPVPYVSHHRQRVVPEQQSVLRSSNVTPWLPSVATMSPRAMKAKSEFQYHSARARRNTPEPPSLLGAPDQAHLGISAFQRVQRLLDDAAEDANRESSQLRLNTSTLGEIASRKPSVSFPLSPGRADACTSPEPTTPQTALSVIVPASFRDEQSLPTSPLPPASPDPAVDAEQLPPSPEIAPTPLPTSPNIPPSPPSTPLSPNMGSSASKLMKSDKKTPTKTVASVDPAAPDVSITLTIERDDGRRIPVNVDADFDLKREEKVVSSVLQKVEMEAEQTRAELLTLLQEHQQLVEEISRLEKL